MIMIVARPLGPQAEQRAWTEIEEVRLRRGWLGLLKSIIDAGDTPRR